MQDHADILKDRIKVTPFGRNCRQITQERIGNGQDKRAENADDGKHRALNASIQLVVLTLSKSNNAGSQRHQENPQQHGSFVTAPQGCRLIDDVKLGVGMISHVGNREIIDQKGMQQNAGGNGQTQCRNGRADTPKTGSRLLPLYKSRPNGNRPEKRAGRRQTQQIVAEFRNHAESTFRFFTPTVRRTWTYQQTLTGKPSRTLKPQKRLAAKMPRASAKRATAHAASTPAKAAIGTVVCTLPKSD